MAEFEGVLLASVGGLQTVLAGDGARYELRAQAKIRHEKLKPMVGDRVSFVPGEGDEYGWLTAILPRRNKLVRPPVANLDRVVVVIAASDPAPDLMLVDRIFVIAHRAGIERTLVVNKRDLDADTCARIAHEYANSGAQVYVTRSDDDNDISALRDSLAGTIHAFCGQSGVGKSSLMNALYGVSRRTGELSDKTRRGRHTTRECTLYPLPGGGMALDTPGFSLLEEGLCDPDLLKADYPEFAPYEGQCRFMPCRHMNEPDCAVKDAVRSGAIDENRWDRYKLLYDEEKNRWRERYD